MLSLFPQLLFLAPLGTTILRIAAGGVFLYLAIRHWEERRALSDVRLPIIGRSSWIPVFASVVEFAIAACLVIGLYTQAAALVGAIAALKDVVLHKRYTGYFPLTTSAAVLLLAICLSLSVSGPGAFSFDLPL